MDVRNARIKKLGRPSIFGKFDVSPDGRYVLVERIHPPYSYQSPAQFFPRSIEVWDLQAAVKHVSIRPATEDVATGGVPVQPRGHHWRPTGPATIVWVEALDGGDPSREVDYRDRVMMLDGGAIVEDAAPEKLFTDPDQERTRSFLRAVLDRN